MICSSAISPSPPFFRCIPAFAMHYYVPPGCRFFSAPPSGRREGEIQGITCLPGRVPLKPRQGPCPWTPLSKNLYLKAPGQGSPETPPGVLPLDPASKKPKCKVCKVAIRYACYGSRDKE